MARVQFALKMLRARLQPARGRCPYCDSSLHHRLQRKWLLIELRKCVHCGLLFRYPTDSEEGALAFYEGDYEGQQATDLPTDFELEALRARGFVDSPYDRSARVRFLRGVAPSGRVLDFGAAWGYGVRQLLDAGYDALGFEVSRVRARFGRDRLGVRLYDDLDQLTREHAGSLDVVYTDHAMEHLPRLREPLERLVSLLKPGGFFVMFVPNGAGRDARARGTRWLTLIGEAHTIAFTPAWLREHLPCQGLAIVSLRSSMEAVQESLLDGEEIVCVARRGAG